MLESRNEMTSNKGNDCSQSHPSDQHGSYTDLIRFNTL